MTEKNTSPPVAKKVADLPKKDAPESRFKIKKQDRVYYEEPVSVVALEQGFYRGSRRRKGDKFVLEAGDVLGSWMALDDDNLRARQMERERPKGQLPHVTTGKRPPKTIGQALQQIAEEDAAIEAARTAPPNRVKREQ